MSSTLLPTGRQVAAARALLGMTQKDLADCTGLAPNTLVSFERGERIPTEQTRQTVRSALEARGIIFSNGDRPSVTLDKAKAIIPI